jgi:ribosomal protein S18 acetylase RimI-like enzyme
VSIDIRRVGLDDVDAVSVLFDAYRQFYGQQSNPGRARDWLGERLQRDESVIWMALRNGTPCGFVQLYRMFSSVRTARLWILNDLFVAMDARRQGVARTLLDAAAQFARDDGAAAILLETGRDNAPARALYRAAGWHEDDSQWYSLPLCQAPSNG